MLRPLLLAASLCLIGCLPAASSAESAESAEGSGPPMRRVARQCEAGVVAEVIDAGPYTYIRYQRTGAPTDRWLVSLHTAATLGEMRDFVWYGEQTDFSSARLGRTFPHLTFGHLGRCPSPE